MALNSSSPVYVPPAGLAVEGKWGGAVALWIAQRFTDPTNRDAMWTNPPRGAMCITLDTLSVWLYDGTRWVDYRESSDARFINASGDTMSGALGVPVIGWNGDIGIHATTAVFRSADGGATFGWVNNAGMSLLGARSFNWPNFGGAVWMQDGVWVRFAPNTYVGGTMACDGPLSVRSGGWAGGQEGAYVRGFSKFYREPGAVHALEVHKDITVVGSESPWSHRQLRVVSQGPGNNSAAITFWAGGVAPILQAYQPIGEVLMAVHSSNTSLIPIIAGSFVVPAGLSASPGRALGGGDDAALLSKVAGIYAHMERKPRATVMRMNPARRAAALAEHSADEDDQYDPLTDASLYDAVPYESDPSRAATDPMVLNAQGERYGLNRDALRAAFPEAMFHDEHGQATQYAVEQVANIALATVGALARKVADLEAQVAALQP